jgi:hypothetical protein
VPTATNTPVPTPTAEPTPTDIPTPTDTPTATPPPSWPKGFQLGVHADDIAEHTDLLRDAGLGWVARYAWHLGGDEVGIGDFLAVAHEHGLLAFVSVAGDWTRGYEPEYQAEFIEALARLAADGADAVAIWDEPNSITSMPAIDPSLYSQMLCDAYTAIKEASPSTLVVSGPPAPTDSGGECSAEACGDAEWLAALAEAGAFECADLVGVRYTAGATGPGTTIGHPSGLDHHSFYFRPIVRRYFEAAGGETPLAFSQFGYLCAEGYGALPEAFWWADGTTSAQQAAWIVEAVEIAASSPMVDMAMLWNLDATDWGGDYGSVRGGYALIRPDGTCPACEALRIAYLDS